MDHEVDYNEMALSLARHIYHRIKIGRSTEPDADYEAVRMLLTKAGLNEDHPGRFSSLDDTLVGKNRDAERRINDIVIPHSYLLMALRKFEEYQALVESGGKKKAINALVAEIEVLFDQSKYPGPKTFPELEVELSHLYEMYKDDLLKDGGIEEAHPESWTSRVLQQGDRAIAKVANERETVSVNILFDGGVVDSERKLAARRTSLERKLKKEKIQYNVSTHFDPDRAEPMITITYNPQDRDRVIGVLDTFIEDMNKGSRGRG